MRHVASTALNAWHDTGELTGFEAIQQRYLERWAWYSGTMFQELSRHSRLLGDPRVYANTSLLFKHVTSIVDFYATTVYQGDLSTDGKPLPDGTRGAIPIDPQVERTEDAEALMVGIAELESAWNWRQNMTLRPQFVAALGDGLTEMVDDIPRGAVYPSMVRPWHVPDIELDFVGNVKAYAIEYMMTDVRDDGRPDTYRFRKEVDKEAFRYFRDDQPFEAYPGGAVIENPYGFVPAIWDRHRTGWGERGVAATDSTRQALVQLNSLLSHSFDFQRKAFAAPIITRGRITRAGQSEVTTAGETSSPSMIDRVLNRMDQRRRTAEAFEVLQGTDNAAILQAQFDIGKTLEIIEFLKRGMLEENPEGSFYHQLREMSQLTGPAVERALGDAVGRVRLARAGYDAQTIKLFQMGLAMSGFRANGAWKTDEEGRARRLTKRQEAFLPFDLDSYREGKLDFGISDRPVVLPTEQERLDLIIQKEAVQTRQGLIELGYSADVPEGKGGESEVDQMLRERRELAAGAFAGGEVGP